MDRSFSNVSRFALAVLLTALSSQVLAGFLEMPDTSEVPEYERETLLLDLDIPEVSDRDPDPEAGPRLNVREFRIQGIVEFPELGISREEISKRVEAIRFDLMEEGEMLDSGYTLDELGEVSDLIAEIEKETKGKHVGSLEVQRLVFLIREQRRKRGITLGMIETVADEITRYYRERGFILAKAYIPKQRVRDGIVTLTLLLGELGEVEVTNAKRYSNKTIENIFKNSMGKPVTTHSIEERLYLVNDLPGLSAQGYFQPGSQVGDTKLTINSISEKKYDVNIRLDNHGSESTGEYRFYSDLYLYNPLGIGDQLQIGVLSSFAPGNSQYASIRYGANFLGQKLRFSMGASSNDFVLSQSEIADSGDSKIDGSSTIFDASFKVIGKRSRIKNTSFTFELAEISSRLRLDGREAGLDDVAQNLSLSYNFDVLNEKKRILHNGRIAFTHSIFAEGAEEENVNGGIVDSEASENPNILQVDYSMLMFVKPFFGKKSSRLISRVSAQYSGKAMSSINQFALGGPTRARGFAVNKFYADDAIYLGADWVFDGPEFLKGEIAGEKLNRMIQPFLFADIAYGQALSLKVEEKPTVGQMADVGFGLKLNFKNNLKGNFVVAFPISSKEKRNVIDPDAEGGPQLTLETVDTKENDVNFYFDLQYTF